MNGRVPAAKFDKLFTNAIPISGLLVLLLANPLSIGLRVLVPTIVKTNIMKTNNGSFVNGKNITDNVNAVNTTSTDLVFCKDS